MEESFKSFLNDVVNLNPTRYDRAVSSVDTITKILKNNQIFGEKFISLKPQGSFRQETIIKPVNPDDDFDVDLLFEMKEVNGWQPVDYLNNLSNEFRKFDTYKDKVDTRGKTRCVTIDYDTDFHIDIVPAIGLVSGEMIMNRKTNNYEITDGDGYAQWFERQNIITRDNFKRFVRLMKYIRDSKKEFEIKSVLLTTLIGLQISASDSSNRDYPDISTSFVTLIKKLDLFLQSNQTMPIVYNPVLPSENFNRHWDQNKYSRFRNKIHEYSEIAKVAHQTKDVNGWRKILGKEFSGAPIVISAPRDILPRVGGLKVGNYSHRKTLSSEGINDPNYYPLSVKISATLYWGRIDHKEINRTPKGAFSSGADLPPHHWLKYQAVGDFEPRHSIYWQVVNTGLHAKEWGKLRGEIEPGDYIHWEPSLFTGVHWIECFVVDSSNNTCVGRSGPFYVVFKNSGYKYDEDIWN